MDVEVRKRKKVLKYVCPECHMDSFMNDDIRDEVYCQCCGLVVTGPPICGVIYPGRLPVFDFNDLDKKYMEINVK